MLASDFGTVQSIHAIALLYPAIVTREFPFHGFAVRRGELHNGLVSGTDVFGFDGTGADSSFGAHASGVMPMGLTIVNET